VILLEHRNHYKYIKRYRHIILVFVKNGFGVLFDKLDFFNSLIVKVKRLATRKDDADNKKLSAGARLRLSFEELGPTFIKLGQILSTRSDILPRSVITELEKLQDSVPPFPFDDVQYLIESEFGEKIENVFREFSATPVAAASIAQVHTARLYSGKNVVVKVQRPDIEKNIFLDLKLLKKLARFIDKKTKYGRLYDFTKMVQDFEDTLKNELDFRTEGENAEEFRKNLSSDKGIKVPDIYWVHTTKRVLIMECIEGIRLNELDELEKAGIDRKLIAKNLSVSMLNQFLRDGFFHADPHPGNIMVLPDNDIVFLDFGMVGRLNEELKDKVLEMLMGFVFNNSRLFIKALIGLDTGTPHKTITIPEKEIDMLRGKYMSLPINRIRVSEVFNDISSLAFTYHIVIPNEFTLFIKTLVTLEGTVGRLDPDFNVLKTAEPIVKKLFVEKFLPKKIIKELIEGFLDYRELFRELPSFLVSSIRKMQEDDSAQLAVKDEHTERRMDRLSKRLLLGLLLLVVSIIAGSAILGLSMGTGSGTEIYFIDITILKVCLITIVIILAGFISTYRTRRN
jgi:ubiquinone biosynthesis protein